MTLQTKDGLAAFLRAVQYHLCVEFTFDKANKTVTEYAKDRGLETNVNVGEKWEEGTSRQIEYDGNIQVCKVPVNPMLIFLHTDQGCFDPPSYTPFASPVANVRSIQKAIVDEQCKEVFINEEQIVHQEDFCVMVYDARGVTDSRTKGIEYRCMLRDPVSDVKLVQKKAQPAT
jgi:hypothetical protein